MATMDVASFGIDMRLLTSATMPEATSRPSSAMPIGRPMAMTDPNASTRMMTAARRPRASLSGMANSWNTVPPYAISAPVMRRARVAVLTSSAIAVCSDCCTFSTFSWMKAIVRSRFTWLGKS